MRRGGEDVDGAVQCKGWMGRMERLLGRGKGGRRGWEEGEGRTEKVYEEGEGS